MMKNLKFLAVTLAMGATLIATGADKVVLKQDFERDMNDWKKSGKGVIENIQNPTGDGKVLSLKSTEENATRGFATKTFDAVSGNSTITFRMLDKNPNHTYSIVTIGSHPNRIKMVIAQNGRLSIDGDSTGAVSAKTLIKADVWYDVKLKIDADNKKIELYLNNEFINSVPMEKDNSNYSVISLGVMKSNTLMIDNLEIIQDVKEREVSGNYDFLDKFQGQHPRIFLNSQELAALRAEIKSDSNKKLQWDRVVKFSDSMLHLKNPTKDVDRGQANVLATLAVTAAVSQEAKYIDKVCSYLEGIVDTEHWGYHHKYGSMDLNAGHALLAVAMAYDLCYEHLSDELKAKVYKKLLTMGNIMNSALYTKIWWHDDYLGNHMWVNLTGLTAAGLAIYDVDKNNKSPFLWLDDSQKYMDKCIGLLGSDGASIEGYTYWQYGLEWLIKYMEFANKFYGKDYSKVDWFKNTGYYGLYLALPINDWNEGDSHVDFDDDRRVNWYGPDYLFSYLATKYNNGHFQYLADKHIKNGHSAPSSIWQELFWSDPNIEMKKLDDLPTMKHFEDLDIVVSRSDWSGNESLVAFVCGAPIGKEATAKHGGKFGDWGSAHVQPDANHFVLFGGGQWLIRDDGYTPKNTCNYNTLLVNNKGQYGSGGMYFNAAKPAISPESSPEIIKVESNEDYDLIVANAEKAYPKELQLTKFNRKMVFVKPNILVVIDDIESKVASDFELRFFPEEQDKIKSTKNGYIVTGKKATLKVQSINATATLDKMDMLLSSGKTMPRTLFKLKQNGTNWTPITIFSWGENGKLADVQANLEKDILKLSIDNKKTIGINLKTGKLQ